MFYLLLQNQKIVTLNNTENQKLSTKQKSWFKQRTHFFLYKNLSYNYVYE